MLLLLLLFYLHELIVRSRELVVIVVVTETNRPFVIEQAAPISLDLWLCFSSGFGLVSLFVVCVLPPSPQDSILKPAEH